MVEFTGTYSATIDDKGRIVLPSSFKKGMGELALEPLVIEKNLHKDCLDIRPDRFWKERVDDFKSTLDPFDEDDDALLQFFYQNFMKVGMAANGRLNIPTDYLSYAKIEKSVKFIGMGEFVRMIAVDELDKTQMTKAEFLQKLKERRKKRTDD
ncbi:MAG: hypothetical protein ABFS16_07050 [Bacteroidota bacterium]